MVVSSWIDFVIFPINSMGLQGDLNSDDELNIVDIVILVNFSLGLSEINIEIINMGDLNSDNVLNVLDIVLLVNLILNG